MSQEMDRVAVVTGASAGVGRATAVALARRGFDVGLVARGRAGLEAAAGEVEALGRKALILPADVADFDAVDAAAERAEQELGPVGVWVNNAMTTVFERFADTAPDDFRRAVEVTFLGQVWGTKAALARMRPRNAGTIVNVGSALAYIGIPLQAAYCASKFACRGFFQSVRAELLEAGSGVRMAMVHLPAVNTPQFDWCKTDMSRHPQPVPPIYQPEVAAAAIVRAALTGQPARVLGSWNRIVVAVGRATPRFGNHFAAVSGTSSQLSDRPIDPDRPANLHSPADDEADFGAHGSFDGRAGGVLDPSFLRSLPTIARQVAQAAQATVAEKLRLGLRR